MDTDFGRNWLLRLLLIALLVGLLAAELREKQDGRGFLKLAIVLVAAGLAGTLAWAGHGIGGAGLGGRIHLAADFVHLIAAAAWVGGLLPLAFMLAAAGRSCHGRACGEFALFRLWDGRRRCAVAHRRNQYLVSGGQHRALTETDYGHLLLVKIALFLVMLGLATVNRLWLTPALAATAGQGRSRDAFRQLRRNVAIELGAGVIILSVVAVLGVTPPGLGEQ